MRRIHCAIVAAYIPDTWVDQHALLILCHLPVDTTEHQLALVIKLQLLDGEATRHPAGTNSIQHTASLQ